MHGEICDHVAIGDLHGHSEWNEHIQHLLERYKKIIFIGDYVDSFKLSDDEILNNLLSLIEVKKNNPDQIILLWGNHDVHYWLHPKHQGKGFRPSMLNILNLVFNDNKELFQVAYQKNNILCTHAGVSQTWINFVKLNDFDIESYLSDGTFENIADLLNEFGKSNKYMDLIFAPGGLSRSAGPCWLRPSQYLHRPLKGYRQIVGHTSKNGIETYLVDGDTSITIIDSLRSCQTYYEF